MSDSKDLKITLVEIPDDAFYSAAGLTPPATCGVCHSSSEDLTDEIGPDGTPIKVCAVCHVDRLVPQRTPNTPWRQVRAEEIARLSARPLALEAWRSSEAVTFLWVAGRRFVHHGDHFVLEPPGAGYYLRVTEPAVARWLLDRIADIQVGRDPGGRRLAANEYASYQDGVLTIVVDDR